MRKLIILCLFIIGCSGSNGKSYSSNGRITTKDSIDLCEPACNKAKSLNCAEGKDLIYPTSCSFDAECESGRCLSEKCTETCVDVCSAFVREGRPQNLQCWPTISECAQIESVCRK